MLDQILNHGVFDVVTSIGATASAIAAILKAFEKKPFRTILSSKTIKVSVTILSGLLAYTLIDRSVIGHEHESNGQVNPPADSTTVEPGAGPAASTGQVESEPPVEEPVETPPTPEPEDPEDNQEYSVRIVTAADNAALRSRVENFLISKNFKILESREIDEEQNKLLYFSQNSLKKAEYVADILNRELNLAESNKFVPKMILSEQKQEKVLQIYLKNQ